MPTTPYKGISVPTTGTESGTWGDELNDNSFAVIDKNLGGITTKTLTNANVTLSAAESQTLIVRLIGTLTGDVQITTACQGFTIVENLTSGAYTLTFTNGVGSALTLVQGGRYIIHTDATNGTRFAASDRIEALSTAGAVRRLSTGAMSTDSGATNIMFVRDNNGSVLSTGIQGDITVPFAATITGVTMLADQTGSLVLDIWKAPYSSYPPNSGNTICASAKPTISSATKDNYTALVGWTTSIAAGDILRFNIDSVSSITRITVAVTVTRF